MNEYEDELWSDINYDEMREELGKHLASLSTLAASKVDANMETKAVQPESSDDSQESEIQKQCKEKDKTTIENTKAYISLYDHMKVFEAVLPLLKIIESANFQNRHWVKLIKITGKFYYLRSLVSDRLMCHLLIHYSTKTCPN